MVIVTSGNVHRPLAKKSNQEIELNALHEQPNASEGSKLFYLSGGEAEKAQVSITLLILGQS